jgi:hypothetical protein
MAVKFRDEALAAHRMSYSIDRLANFAPVSSFTPLIFWVFLLLGMGLASIAIGFSQTVHKAVLNTQTAPAEDEINFNILSLRAATEIHAADRFFIFGGDHIAIGRVIAVTRELDSHSSWRVTIRGKIRSALFRSQSRHTLTSTDSILVFSGYGGLESSGEAAAK